jgi:hypothetical protein
MKLDMMYTTGLRTIRASLRHDNMHRIRVRPACNHILAADKTVHVGYSKLSMIPPDENHGATHFAPNSPAHRLHARSKHAAQVSRSERMLLQVYISG